MMSGEEHTSGGTGEGAICADGGVANLRGADFSGAFLREASLSRADLTSADLSGADACSADLRGAALTGANLRDARLAFAHLQEANLAGACLEGANLVGADLRHTTLAGAHLAGAKLSGAMLRDADLSGADLSGADLTQANLTRANLVGACLNGASLERALLSGCRVYGVSAWNLRLDGATQEDLILDEGVGLPITVDTLETAQLLWLLLDGKRTREMLDQERSRFVLLMGKFGDRPELLGALKKALRARGYSPVSLSIERPANLATAETIIALNHLARFVILDVTGIHNVEEILSPPEMLSGQIHPVIQCAAVPDADLPAAPGHLNPLAYHSPEDLVESLDVRMFVDGERV
ncbi:MAG TPA: pentapeptide repeat-containing protein [Armatimonadota bacterium]|nr:pentapeptide repeat-containing protein [Armatimonadota bacterium]